MGRLSHISDVEERQQVQAAAAQQTQVAAEVHAPGQLEDDASAQVAVEESGTARGANVQEAPEPYKAPFTQKVVIALAVVCVLAFAAYQAASRLGFSF